MNTGDEVFTALGFTVDVAGNGKENEGTWVKEFGPFKVQVETLDWKWVSHNNPDNPYDGHNVPVPLEKPTFRVYLPHQCDEWDIVGDRYHPAPRENQERVMAEFLAAATAAAAALGAVRQAVLS